MLRKTDKAMPQDSKNALAMQRACHLGKARMLVIKVGSAVISDQNGLDLSSMANIAAQISDLCATSADSGARRQAILVSSGAVAAGRACLAGYGRNLEKYSLAQKQAAAAVGQGLLMEAWTNVFKPLGIPVAQILLTRDDFRSRERFLNARNTFSELNSFDVLPVVNENDTVSVSEIKFGDNDCLSSLLVNLVEADLFINLTSAPGVKADNPQTNPDAPFLEAIEDISSLDIRKICGEKTASGSGGMHSKLLSARRVSQLGVGTLIIPGRKKDALLAAYGLAPSPDAFTGTWVCPAEHTISRRKFWLAYQSNPVGRVEIDKGAATALGSCGASLLPGGIVSVEGVFSKGSIIEISSGGQNLGVGLTNYNSATLKKIIGLKRHEVAAILGQAHYPEVVHRDNMLLHAAI